jgi:hypothetical protein
MERKPRKRKGLKIKYPFVYENFFGDFLKAWF